MKRVVIFSAFLTPFRSGAEACAEEVALRLHDHYDVTIVTARMRKNLPRKDKLAEKVPVIRVGFGIPFDKWLYPFLAPFVARKLKPDVIHAVLETFAGVALHMCKAVYPRARQVLTLQTTNRNFLRRHILRTPDVVTAISGHLIRQAADLGRKDAVLIPNGISHAAIRRACDIQPKIAGRILFVGRLEEMKGVDVLLQALKMTQSEWHAHIVGEGSQRRELEKLASHLRIDNRVTFTGYLSGPDLLREYAEAEIFCGLSRSEALGNVFLEAQAAGCAVVATNVGGIPEIIHNGRTGILVNPNDPKKAADAIRSVLENIILRRTLFAAAVENAAQYDWNAIAERYAALYDARPS